MRRPPLSTLALVAALAPVSVADAQHRASAPHASAPHMQPMHMPHMMQPQFFSMPQVQPRASYASPTRSGHTNAAASHANAATSHANATTHHAGTSTGHAGTSKKATAHAGTGTGTKTALATPAASAASTNVPLAPGMTPDHTMNFPSNVIHFPSEVSITNTGLPTMNFPSQSSIFPFPTVAGALGGGFKFPSYVTNLGSSAMVPGTLARSSSIPSGMLSVPVGAGGMAHGLHSRGMGRTSSSYGNYRSYTNSNAAQQHMTRLINDLDSLQPGFQTTASHHNRLQGDLMAVSINNQRPSSTMVHQLARNLAQGMTRRQSPTIDTASLAQGLRIVVNGGHLAQGDVTGAIQQSQSLLHQGGFTPADSKAVVGDMRALVGQARLGRGNGSGTSR